MPCTGCVKVINNPEFLATSICWVVYERPIQIPPIKSYGFDKEGSDAALGEGAPEEAGQGRRQHLLGPLRLPAVHGRW